MKASILLLIIFTALSFYSCKEKGCTDPASLNYNALADEDDGSCLYCDSTKVTIADRTEYLRDSYFGSSHYNQDIVRFDIHQETASFNFEQCGTTGCFVTLRITNLLNQTMLIDYQLYSNTSIYLNSNEMVTLKPDETMDMGIIGSQVISNCYPITTSNITIQLQSQPIYY